MVEFLFSKGDDKIISRIFEKVDRTLLEKDNIRVLESRARAIAFTDRKDVYINFPMVKAIAGDNEMIYFVLLKTLNLHEDGHIRYTIHNAKLIKKVTTAPDFFSFLNAFEDARIETAFSLKWRASEKYFKFAFGKIVMDTLLKDMSKLTPKDYAEMFARIYGTKFIYCAEEYKDTINTFERIVLGIFGAEKLARMKQLIDEYLTSKDTMERIKKAFEVYTIIGGEREAKDCPEFGNCEGSGKGEANKEASRNIKDLIKDIKTLTDALKLKAENPKEFEKIYDVINSEVSMDSVEKDLEAQEIKNFDTQDSKELGTGKSEESKGKGSDKESKEDEECEGIGDIQSSEEHSDKKKKEGEGKMIDDAEMKELKQELNKNIKELAEVLASKIYTNWQIREDIARTKEVYNHMAKELENLKTFIGKRKVEEGYKFQEPLDVRRLVKSVEKEVKKIKNDLGYGISRGNKSGKFNAVSFITKKNGNNWNKVFDRRKMNTHNRCKVALSLIIDSSGSVHPNNFTTQLKAVYVISKAMEDTKNSCEVVEFSGDCGYVLHNPEQSYKIIKGYDDTCFNGDWQRHFTSGNWLCPALTHSFSNLRILNKKGFGSRFAIVVTDGELTDDGNTKPQMERLVQKMNREGIQVFQFCVGRGAEPMNFFNKSIIVWGYPELESKLKQLILEIQKQVAIQTKEVYR